MKRGASRPPSPTPSIFSALRALPLFRAMQCAAADPADDAALETLVEHNRYVEPFLCAIVAWNVMVGVSGSPRPGAHRVREASFLI